MAYRQLLKLPSYANDLGDKAASNGAELRKQVITTTAELRERATQAYRQANQRALKFRRSDFDLDRLREIAMRNAGQFIVSAQAAQERAVAFYGQLVAHGEKVVGTGVVQAADTVNADINETNKPAAVTAKPESNGQASSNGHASVDHKTMAKKTTAAPAKKTTPNTTTGK